MMQHKKLLSIISPCFNEEYNIDELYKRVSTALLHFPQYDFEYIFIDNASTDGTVTQLKTIAAADKRVKIIVNTRNFGHIRSPYWGIIQTSGAATIYLASDLQDPPELIPSFIEAWEQGYKIVLATKPVSQINPLTNWLRKAYYRFLDGISDITLAKDTTGFGLYDKVVLDMIREINSPYPYLRGMVCELGYNIKTITFNQPRRIRGISKNNFYTLYDIAMLGIVSHSKIPLRIAAFTGFGIGLISISVALMYLLLKIIYWNSFPMGIAPVAIGIFFLFGFQMLSIGILGEYIGSIHSYVQKLPVVVEKERINFETGDPEIPTTGECSLKDR